MGGKAEELQAKHPNRKITGHVCDVTKSAQVNETMSEVREQHGSKVPNVLINSAGIGYITPIETMTEQDFDRIISINLKGTFLITQAVVKLLIENFPSVKFDSPTASYASIVNLASQAGKRGFPSYSAYSMTKAGVEGFAFALGKELAQYRIRVNALRPYFINTPMVHKQDDDPTRPARMQMLKQVNPMKRFGDAEEVAQTALFLASDASSYITSTSIDVSGGI